MPECHILQGLPGSGKSTYAGGFMKNVCSADPYHMFDGVYQWKPENVGLAHKACMRQFLYYVYQVVDVCVDNTNTTTEEMVPYVKVAAARGYKVTVHTFACDIETSAARNTHNVPIESIKRMARRMSKPPKRWGVKHIIHKQEN